MQNTDDATYDAKADFEIDRGKAVDLSYLINKLNFINFIEGTIIAVYRHETYRHQATLALKPMPCSGPELKCRWLSPDETDNHLSGYHFSCILIGDNGNYIHVSPKSVHILPDGLNLTLPDVGYQLKKSVKPLNPNLKTEIFQKGVCFLGRLLRFSTEMIEVEIQFQPPQTFSWIDLESPLNLVLSEGKQIFYSSICRIEKEQNSGRTCRFELHANTNQYRRFRPKKYRSTRVVLQPAPDIVFIHPLTLEKKTLKVDDISSLGFSITTNQNHSEIIPGLIIPNIHLELAGEVLAICDGQVVHRSELTQDPAAPLYRCGLAILDINIKDHTRLHQLVQQAENPNAYVSNHVDQEELWEFFFETGFIYPDKYDVLKNAKKDIKKTYQKLYVDQPSFARHFIYQKEGVILGHMAMLRFYSRAWIIHHHAARAANASRAGLVVLEQIGMFINESHALDTIRMNFVFCFYRPENKFPSRVFGGAVRFAKDPQVCSLDRFAYGHFQPVHPRQVMLPAPWALIQAHGEDLKTFSHFYQKESGGLMIRAFDLDPDCDRLNELAHEYEQIGFKRERLLFALKRKSELKAIIEVNLSDMGLNMSDLTNCIRLFWVETKGVDRDIMNAVLNIVSEFFDKDEVSVMSFPSENTDFLPFSVERNYMLWTLNLQHTDRYLTFSNRIVRFSSRSK